MRFLLIALMLTGCAATPIEEAPVEPRIIRDIAIIPCASAPLYIFIFNSGYVAVFDLQRATESPDVRRKLLDLIDRAKRETTLKEVVLRQHCEREGSST